MTLFTTLLVLIFERLFKLGEHWQLDHRLEAFFRRVETFFSRAHIRHDHYCDGRDFFTVYAHCREYCSTFPRCWCGC